MKTFCPLILFHDNLSKELSEKLNENQHEYRIAIDRHLNKTSEMLELNARYWILENDIKVSPSTSTTSNISSSSSSSGDSIATLEHAYPAVVAVKQPKLKTAENTTTTKKRRRGNLPKEVTEFLRKWLIQHKKHPYPAEKEKIDLARHTGLTVNQISNWFINARRRILQPMLESENLNAQFMGYPPPETYEKRTRREYYPYSTATTASPMKYSEEEEEGERSPMFYRTRSSSAPYPQQHLPMR